jgi:hypothetical protein
MARYSKRAQGSHEWFAMVGAIVCEALDRSGSQSALDWTFVERYSDGKAFPDGLMQGIRFDVCGELATYRVGVGPDERGDVTVEVTVAAARALNLLYSDDPQFDLAWETAVATGALQIEGDLSLIATALAQTHDSIVYRTV